MNVRLAVIEDLPLICEIEARSFGAAYPAFFFRQAFDLWRNLLLVAEDGDGITGYVLGAPADEARAAWVLSLAVCESARGQGVGKQLLLALLDAMRERRFETVRLTVHPGNPAVALYERAGFTKVGLEPHYFHANDPRVVMELKQA